MRRKFESFPTPAISWYPINKDESLWYHGCITDHNGYTIAEIKRIENGVTSLHHLRVYGSKNKGYYFKMHGLIYYLNDFIKIFYPHKTELRPREDGLKYIKHDIPNT